MESSNSTAASPAVTETTTTIASACSSPPEASHPVPPNVPRAVYPPAPGRARVMSTFPVQVSVVAMYFMLHV
jgi:hypothetical protein